MLVGLLLLLLLLLPLLLTLSLPDSAWDMEVDLGPRGEEEEEGREEEGEVFTVNPER